jgi:TonB family protein
MVNLASDRKNLPSDKKSFVPPQAIAFSDKQDLNPTQANETPSSVGSQGVSQPEGGVIRKAIHSPKPHYPLASKKLREQGLVVVRLCVNQQGIVDGVDVYKSSGFISLDYSALKALALWRFTPVAFNSTGLSLQCFQTPVQFTLEG